MSKISIVDLEVFYSIGTTPEERAKPQRLLLTIDLEADFTAAIASDRVERTINYQTLAQRLIKYGERHSWNLLERLAANISEMIMLDFKPSSVTVEVKKFVIPQAQYVAVTVSRSR
jgi:7,8-dihydroneopterin aldolase/epimerase/oxygenase